MSRRPALVLLPAAVDGPGTWTGLTSALGRAYRVLAPEPGAAGPVLPLTGRVAAVTSAMDAAGVASATLCGHGLGAVVALQLAAEAPDRVDGLVLMTRQVALSPVLLSLPAAVLRLLSAAAVQRLGAAPPQVTALLDQVRPVDAAPLAARVTTPAVVVCGARDRVNRRASAALARALPAGRLELVPGARDGWPSAQPERLAPLLRRDDLFG